MTMRPALCALLVALTALPAGAAGPPAGELALTTGRGDGRFTLDGRGAWQQLLVSAAGRDLTRAAAYTTSPPGVVAVDATGLVTPLTEGQATITATSAGRAARVAVTVRHLAADRPINFANEVVPIFTRLGCNSGGCHGKASGQNGFRLSLLGFEPEEDYEYLVKEARGRRLFPAAPPRSLLLTKAAGQVAHGGGRRLEPGSAFYQLLERWVAQGAPYGRKDDPAVVGLDLLPAARSLARGAQQQLVAVARLSDGTTRDVTRMAQFEANAPELAEVSETGLVTAGRLPGRVAVMARFQSHVAVFRATVPLGAPVDRLPPPRTFIDRLVFKQLRELGLPPSALADDATFVRRATLDLAGRLPTRQEAEAFVGDTGPGKYEKLIDRLLASGGHADYFANKWSALLRNRRASPQDDPRPTAAFHAWLREAVANNTPYDRLVRDVLTATGDEVKVPPVVWSRELRSAPEMAEDAAQLFLGQRLGCARCHHHPQEKWGQDDYWALAAFFATVEVKFPPPLAKAKAKAKKDDKPKPPPPRFASVTLRPGEARAVNPRTNRPVKPAGLGAAPAAIAPGDDPRQKLADWMTEPNNPFFARALVNRYWKHFMGRGLVDPEDDLRATNPASNPELLDALARDFVASKYDLKKLIRTICLSTVYRLSAVPNAHNAGDRQAHSRFLPRRLHAEVLLDAIDDVTGARTAFKGATAGTRAVQLPDNLFESYFLSVFGRPDAASACECERSGDASLAQALHMLNSDEVLKKAAGPRARALARDKRPHAERLRELYLTALSRPPSEEELRALLAYLGKEGRSAQDAYEDIVWAVINMKEFHFNH